MSAPTQCPAGSFCSTDGLLAVSGACQAGSYCPAGSNSSQQIKCDIGYMCPLASMTAPVLCASGFYCQTTGRVDPTGPCDGGYYCAPGASSATPAGGICTQNNYCTFCDRATVSVLPFVNLYILPSIRLLFRPPIFYTRFLYHRH